MDLGTTVGSSEFLKLPKLLGMPIHSGTHPEFEVSTEIHCDSRISGLYTPLIHTKLYERMHLKIGIEKVMELFNK